MTNYGQLDNNGYLFNETGSQFVNGGSGVLNNHGTLDNNGILTNNGALANSGVLTNNGALTNSSSLTNSGEINGAGTYTQTGGETVNDGIITQAVVAIQKGILSGNGVINGTLTIDSEATVKPGHSPGTITVNGIFISNGTLLFEVAGLNDGEFSVLQINGDAFFNGGTIEFDFINGFTPAKGDSWQFLTAGTITGWDSLNFVLEGLPNPTDWDFTCLNGILLITEAPAAPIPSTLPLLLGGLMVLLSLNRRRQMI